ncbi:hypothetical protein FA95DRAFT_1667986 [Auriscalpium vulgare]|uniref:Uncharacterized protein n=1 Tax=Auriscalpium vulgare TaxID=40419 RepID=A0ACB8RSE4_9AGAM|nr:hypothetical protein FA95DRAFT_1667986 [Auriscalpium vulgare]
MRDGVTDGTPAHCALTADALLLAERSAAGSCGPTPRFHASSAHLVAWPRDFLRHVRSFRLSTRKLVKVAARRGHHLGNPCGLERVFNYEVEYPQLSRLPMALPRNRSIFSAMALVPANQHDPQHQRHFSPRSLDPEREEPYHRGLFPPGMASVRSTWNTQWSTGCALEQMKERRRCGSDPASESRTTHGQNMPEPSLPPPHASLQFKCSPNSQPDASSWEPRRQEVTTSHWPTDGSADMQSRCQCFDGIEGHETIWMNVAHYRIAQIEEVHIPFFGFTHATFESADTEERALSEMQAAHCARLQAEEDAINAAEEALRTAYAVDDEANSAARRALRQKRNFLLPVARLSPEILRKIFTVCSERDRPQLLERSRFYPGWLTIIARTAYLDMKVDFSEDESLSAGAPLLYTLKMTVECWDSVLDDFLGRHAPALRNVYFSAAYTAMPLTLSIFSHLTSLHFVSSCEPDEGYTIDKFLNERLDGLQGMRELKELKIQLSNDDQSIFAAEEAVQQHHRFSVALAKLAYLELTLCVRDCMTLIPSLSLPAHAVACYKLMLFTDHLPDGFFPLILASFQCHSDPAGLPSNVLASIHIGTVNSGCDAVITGRSHADTHNPTLTVRFLEETWPARVALNALGSAHLRELTLDCNVLKKCAWPDLPALRRLVVKNAAMVSVCASVRRAPPVLPALAVLVFADVAIPSKAGKATAQGDAIQKLS